MKKLNVLLISDTADPWLLKSTLEQAGLNVFMLSDPKETYDTPENIDIVVGGSYFIHHDPTLFTRLKWVQINSAGYDRIPVEKLKNQGILVSNARGVYSAPIAEWIVLQLLTFMKEAHFFYENQKIAQWKRRADLSEFEAQKILIVGTGSIAYETAIRLKPFGVTITGVNRSGHPAEGFDATISMDEIATMLPIADAVIITLPLNDKTRNLFDKKMISQMKKGSTLLNIGRGGVVNEEDLCESLMNHHLGHAALDVFTHEPLSTESPLWNCENLILTPHNCFSGNHTAQRLAQLIERNVICFIDEECLENLI